MAQRTDAFISYSRKDKEFIRTLADRLDDNSVTYWVDWEGIPLASDWWNEIQIGIDNADSFIFVISEDSVTSKVCRQEIDHAVESHKRIIPILWREIENKEAFNQMHPSISSHNWIFMDEGKDLDEATTALVDTLQADPDHIKEHTRLLVRAKEWVQDEQATGKLLVAEEVNNAENWLAIAANKTPNPTSLHHQYVLASREQMRKIQRRLLTGVSIALVVSVFLTIAAVFFYFQAVEAQEQAERNAEQALSLALSASSQLALLADNEIDLAVALAVAANDIDEAPTQVERILADAVYSPGTRFLLDEATDDINSVAFSPDGSQMLTASMDSDIRIYDTATSQLVADLVTRGLPLDVAAFSHDGTMVVMGDCAEVDEQGICIEGDAVVYDIASGEILQTFIAHSTDVVSVAFSPDDRLIMTGSDDTTARIWDIEAGEVVHTLDAHNGSVRAIDFHPTEPVVLTYAIDTAPITWDLNTGEIIREFTEHQVLGEPNLDVVAALFSPDGRTILSSFGIDLRLWNYESGTLIRTYTSGHTSFVE